MIKGVHTMFYSDEAEELRAFLRDVLELSFTDVGEGWLIFDLPEADMGVHPTQGTNGKAAGQHDISFYTDDIAGTVEYLKSRKVEFLEDITDQGFGLVTHFRMPGGVTVQLYQPHYSKK